jgi:hypothetical protein
LLLLIEAEKEEMGLKDPTFWTLATTSEKTVTPAAMVNLT